MSYIQMRKEKKDILIDKKTEALSAVAAVSLGFFPAQDEKLRLSVLIKFSVFGIFKASEREEVWFKLGIVVPLQVFFLVPYHPGFGPLLLLPNKSVTGVCF